MLEPLSAMNGQLSRHYYLFGAGLLYQTFGQSGLLSICNHPADHVSAEDIDDHIQIVIGPFIRVFQFGDIPGPNLIGSGGKQFWFSVNRTLHLLSTLFDITVFTFEQSIHGPDGTMVKRLHPIAGHKSGGVPYR